MRIKAPLYRTICADFKLGLKFPLLLAALGVTLGFCFDNWNDLQFVLHGSTSVHYYVWNSFSFGGVFSEDFSAIMATIPFATNYCREVEECMGIYKLSRCGERAYVHSKFLVAAVLGGLVLLLGGLLFMLALATRVPLVTDAELLEFQGYPFYDALASRNGLAYFAVILYLSFLGGALWASVGLCASAYFPSIYVAVCAPFLFRFTLTELGRLLRLPNSLRLELLLAARGQIYSDAVTLAVTTAAVLALILLCDAMFAKRVRRRICDGT